MSWSTYQPVAVACVVVVVVVVMIVVVVAAVVTGVLAAVVVAPVVVAEEEEEELLQAKNEKINVFRAPISLVHKSCGQAVDNHVNKQNLKRHNNNLCLLPIF